MTWKRFKHWWVNVFWYHYGKGAVIVLAIVGVLIFSIRDMMNRITPDFTYVVVTNGNFSTDGGTFEELTKYFSEITPAINPTGQSFINSIVIDMTDATVMPYERLILTVVANDNFMYIADRTGADWILHDSFMRDLRDFGFRTDELYENQWVRADHIPLIKQSFWGEREIYIGIRFAPEDMDVITEISYDLSVQAMLALLGRITIS